MYLQSYLPIIVFMKENRDNKQQNNDISYYLAQIFCKNPQNLVKQRITPHFLTTDHPNYYEFTTKE